LSHIVSNEGAQDMDTAQANNDTHLTPVLFRDGTDRREGPRVPYEHPVQVGNSYDTPYATVWAENLSPGGIHILTDRPAKIGAHFSVKLALPNGEEVFIPEAEIIYNRAPDEDGVGGFGASFVSVSAEVAAKLEEAARFASAIQDSPVSASMIVDSSTALPMVAGAVQRPQKLQVSDLWLSSLQPSPPEEAPTVAVSIPPAARDDEPLDGGVDLTCHPEPTGDFEPLSVVPHEPDLDEDEDKKEDTDVIRQRQPQRKQRGRVQHVVGELGAVRARVARRASVHPLLWGSLVAGGVLGLILSAALIRSRTDDAVAHASALDVSAEGMRGDTQRVLIDDGRAVVGVVPVADPTPPALPAAKKITPLPKLVELPKKAPAKREKVAPKKAESKKAAPVPQRAGVTFGISASAAVLRTFVLKAPSRFVIDLVGQEGAVNAPAATGLVKNVRVGDHPGYTRIVLDAAETIAVGKGDKRGDQLVVTLER